MLWWKIRNILWRSGRILNSENVLVRYRTKQFMGILADAEIVEDFDVDMYFRLVEKMTVFKGEKIIVSLLNGIEIEVVIE